MSFLMEGAAESPRSRRASPATRGVLSVRRSGRGAKHNAEIELYPALLEDVIDQVIERLQQPLVVGQRQADRRPQGLLLRQPPGRSGARHG